MLTLLRKLSQQAKGLLITLQQEQKLLRDPAARTALIELTQKKDQQVNALAKLENDLLSTIKNNHINQDTLDDRVKQYIANNAQSQQQQGELLTAWQQAKQQLNDCQRQLTINGSTISTLLESTRRKLDILTLSTDNEKIYNDDGKME